MVPRVVLMKSCLVSINIDRQVNASHSKTTANAARPMSYLSKTAHSTIKSLIYKNTTFKNSNFNQRGKNLNIARPKAVVNVVKGNNVNAVKASACWVWKPKTKVVMFPGRLSPTRLEWKIDTIEDLSLKEGIDLEE
ncbi:hypothetical protein Tco_0177656 [Tanacetum coccineum]